MRKEGTAISAKEKLEKRLAEYMQTDDFALEVNDLACDYRYQGLPVPPKEELLKEAADEARKCLRNIMVCEKKGHLWHETADPENGTSDLTCRRCGTVEHCRW